MQGANLPVVAEKLTRNLAPRWNGDVIPMPMMPSPLAVLALAGVKVGGYAWFARRLNDKTGQRVGPIKFGITKTVIGLIGGVTYLTMLAFLNSGDPSTVSVFLGAAPVRMLVWVLVLRLFYDFRGRTRLRVFAVVLGTLWSYALDGVMWLIYQIIPGMTMPVC